MISAYSFVTSVVLFNISLLVVYMLRRKKGFIARYGIQTLVFITVLGFIRLISPVDLGIAHIIRSYEFVPAVQSGLQYQPIGNQISVGGLLLSVWAIGTVIFIAKDVLELIRFKRIRNGYVSCEDAVISAVADELGIKHKVVITPCVDTPHVAGCFRQIIYVPPIMLSEVEWKHVLMHEMQHIAAHDQLIKLLFRMLRSLFWWNPVSHLFLRELEAMLELRCDSAVTAQLSEEESLSYFEAILSAIRNMRADNAKASVPVGAVSEAKSNIKERYEVYLHSNKRASKKLRNAIQISIFLLFILSYCVIVQPAYMPPEEDLIGADEVTDNIMSIIITDGDTYWLIVDDEKMLEISEEELSEFPYNTFPIYVGGD